MLADFGTKLVPKADPNRPHSRQSRSNYRHPSGFLLRCYVGTAAGFAAGRWIHLRKLKMPITAHGHSKMIEKVGQTTAFHEA